MHSEFIHLHGSKNSSIAFQGEVITSGDGVKG